MITPLSMISQHHTWVIMPPNRLKVQSISLITDLNVQCHFLLNKKPVTTTGLYIFITGRHMWFLSNVIIVYYSSDIEE